MLFSVILLYIFIYNYKTDFPKLLFRLNPRNFQLITLGDERNFRRTNFNPSDPTIIYLMGFSEATTGISTVTLRDGELTIIHTILFHVENAGDI